MRIFSTPTELQLAMRGSKANGASIAFVPTMGNLHDGHISLVNIARQRADRVIVSIFVNPMQFDQADDLENYPRTLDNDLKQLADVGVDWVFSPTIEDIYPAGSANSTKIVVPGISEVLEGASRQGHFAGVATVVGKLFNLIQPDIAVFGEKDFQQLLVVRKMVADLNMRVRVISGKTLREKDGLAMSSRNSRLTPQQRQLAPELYKSLSRIVELIESGAKNFSDLEKNTVDWLRKIGFQPDYISVRNAHDFCPADAGNNDVVVLGAARLGSIRLIDNLSISLKNKE